MPKGKAILTSEKIKPIALAVIGFYSCLNSEGISQLISNSVSQLVTRKFHLIIFKVHSNLLKAFWVDLKACLNLVLPNQYCFIIVVENFR